MKPSYALVGFGPERIDYESSEKSLADWLGRDLNAIDANTGMRKGTLVGRCNHLVLQYHLADLPDRTRKAMRDSLDYTEEYLFGAWRDQVPSGNDHKQPPSREFQDTNGLWSDELRFALLCCACLGEWERAARIARFARDDVRLDPEQTPENRAWLLRLAGALAGRPDGEMEPFERTIEEGRRKREKLLLALLEAVLHGDDTHLAKAAKAYFKYYKTSESKSQNITRVVMIDGSLLTHYARHLGRELETPDNLAGHLIPSL